MHKCSKPRARKPVRSAQKEKTRMIPVITPKGEAILLKIPGGSEGKIIDAWLTNNGRFGGWPRLPSKVIVVEGYDWVKVPRCRVLEGGYP